VRHHRNYQVLSSSIIIFVKKKKKLSSNIWKQYIYYGLRWNILTTGVPE